MEIAVWVYRAVTDTSKDMKLTDKLLKNPERESQNPGKNFCGGEGRGLGRHNIVIFCLTFFIKMPLFFSPRRLEKGKTPPFTSGFPRSLSAQKGACLNMELLTTSVSENMVMQQR